MSPEKAQGSRGSRALNSVALLMVASVFWMCYRDDDTNFWLNNIKTQIKGNQLSYVMTFSTVGFADFIVGELIIRFCVFCNLIRQCEGRTWLYMAKSAFLTDGVKQFLVFPVFMSMLSFLTLHGGNYLLIWSIMNNTWNYAIIMAVALLPYILGLKEPTRVEMSYYLEKNKLNVGHGLAWSYYFGYLKLILPSLQTRLTNWQEKQLEKSKMVYKLYILVPSSCYCYPSLENADNRMSVCKPGPETINASRSGNISRTYSNTVYRFQLENDKTTYFCCAEYATPVLSLYEMSQHEEAGLSVEDRHVQRRQFCATLNAILDRNPTFRASCKVIIFDDIDTAGNEVKICRILKENIERDLRETVKERIL